MGVKEFIEKIGEKQRNRKEMIRQMDEQVRITKLVENMSKSSNEREWERFQKEDREERIKEELEVMRKKRQEDINFHHNPLNTKNIMKAEWEVLKEKNMFGERSNMFTNNNFVHKNNLELLNNGNILQSHGGGLI